MSRLGNIYKDEVKMMRRTEHRLVKSFPLKGIMGVVVSLMAFCFVAVVLVSLSMEGSVSVVKKDIGLDSNVQMQVSLPINYTVEKIDRVVDIVLPMQSTSTTTSQSTTQTMTTSTLLFTYGHERMPDGQVDPYTGVGSKSSGRDCGSCCRGGLER